MIRLMLGVLLFAAIERAAVCVQVGNNILGRDLKSARAGFSALIDTTSIGFAPLPGVRRVFTRRDLARIAERIGGTEFDGSDVCFERSVAALSTERLQAAMEISLNRPRVSLEVVDYTRARLPEGDIEFPLAGLTRTASNPETPVIWRGRLRYAGGGSAAIWAMVRIAETRTWVESVTPLSPDRIVTGDQVVLRTGLRFPLAVQGSADPTRIAGRKPRRAIAAGQMLFESMFEEPPLVNKGDPVRIEVRSGGVALGLDASAETGGRLNDRIVVIDPSNGQRYKTRIVGKGKVIIDVREKGGTEKNPMAGSSIADSGAPGGDRRAALVQRQRGQQD